MTVIKLKDRITNYETAATTKLLGKVPLIITVNGRGFSKTTSLLEKPFSAPFVHCMSSCLLKLVQEIEGAIFGYTFNDEIVIVVRNDQTIETTPWYDNDAQKIASAAASITTLQFNQYANSIELNVLGDCIFTSKCFVVPNMTEAINVLVLKQQLAAQLSIQFACFYALLNEHKKSDIKEMLNGTSFDDKVNLLAQECKIDFNSYPSLFRQGIACYRAPTVVKFDGNDIIKNKWTLNTDLPTFTKDHSFLSQIFNRGNDIFRKGD